MSDPAVHMPRQVVIAGDVVVDHHLYTGQRPKPDIAEGRGVRHVRSIGGAAGVRRLLEALAAEETSLHAKELALAEAAKAEGRRAADPRPAPVPISCALGVSYPEAGTLYAAHHAFALWRPHKLTQAKDEKQLVWRTDSDLALGYGHDPIPGTGVTPHVPIDREVPVRTDVLVLDDAGSQFRKGVHSRCWHLPARRAKAWIVLKLSEPIAQGDLWRALVPDHAQRLIVVVSAEDLRRETVRIGERLSWEQTLEDLATELERPTLKPLAEAAHLIITFGGDAAVLISREQTGVARFCFDAGAGEGEFASRHDGKAIGYMSCMAAALAYGLTQAMGGAPAELARAVESGLRGMRDLHYRGHGLRGDGAAPPDGFPAARLAAAMRGPATKQGDFSRMDIPWPPPVAARGTWMMIETSQRPLGSDGPRSLVGLATEVLRRGAAVYGRLPHLRLGTLVTSERTEIEALRGIRQLMLNHRRANSLKDRPLSIGVFGPPGAGKSFAVKQLAIELFGPNAWLEFNLSQFDDAHDLIGAFHQVRDRVLSGTIPVVFWDEFDSRNYQWLRSLLAPMQDGKFQEGQITHPIGNAVFVFAGGTATSFSALGPGKGADDQEQTNWRLSKGRDFKSRLDAYYDVVGPNRRRIANLDDPDPKPVPDPADFGYPLRRALLIRGLLGYEDSAPLQIDADLARALLLVPDYTHGSRSLEKLVRPLAGEPGANLRRSALPPRDQIGMHVDPAAFYRLLDRDTSFTDSVAIEELAKAIHAYWLNFKEEPGIVKTARFAQIWQDLKEADRDDNRAAARRIPAVLALAGLGVTQGTGGEEPDPVVLKAHLHHNIERLAEAEHDGWQAFRERNGWRFSPYRDDRRLLHPLLVPYARLTDPVKQKDRDGVDHYPEMVALAGFRIVWLGDEA